MKWLESAPHRYDAGMRLITFGAVEPMRREAASRAVPRQGVRVLEIGCGTGAVTQLLVDKKADVVGIDENPEMLEQAATRLADADSSTLRLCEQTASEIDRFPAGEFDSVVASMALSEMSSAERSFVLRAAGRLLKPTGVLVLADEVRPRRSLSRLLAALFRGPQVLLAWIIAGSVSHPIADLGAEMEAAGFSVTSERRWLFGTLAVLVGERSP
jgi:demethylmenaquinone methyltransferase/2-methoxy-6-polyprenyl-1,4-benzoquinol methylase